MLYIHPVNTTVEAGLPNITGLFESRPHTSGSSTYGGGVDLGDGKLFTMSRHTGSRANNGVAEASGSTYKTMLSYSTLPNPMPSTVQLTQCKQILTTYIYGVEYYNYLIRIQI